jgi:hypothetical protein
MCYFPGIRHRRRSDKNNVESNGHTIIFSMNGKKILSCFYNTALFFKIHAVGKTVKSINRPGFHFNKDDGLAVYGDKIDFAAPGTDIPGYDPEPGGLKVHGGLRFSLPSGGNTPRV